MTSDDIAAALDLTFDQLPEEFGRPKLSTDDWQLVMKALGLFCYHLGWQAGYKEGEEVKKEEASEQVEDAGVEK